MSPSFQKAKRHLDLDLDLALPLPLALDLDQQHMLTSLAAGKNDALDIFQTCNYCGVLFK